jgi:hypothetical protein
VRSQERHDLSGWAEGIGDDRAVVQRQRGRQLAVHLGQEQGSVRRSGGAVEGGEAQERALVVGVPRADEDLCAERVHVTMVTRWGHKGK